MKIKYPVFAGFRLHKGMGKPCIMDADGKQVSCFLASIEMAEAQADTLNHFHTTNKGAHNERTNS